MAFEIVTITPTTVSGAYAVGDVVFDLTEVPLPSRACKLISAFMEVSGAVQIEHSKIGILFFRKNKNSFGTAHEAVSISASDFTENQYIGKTFVGFNDNARASGEDTLLPNVVDNIAFYYPCSWSTDIENTPGNGRTDRNDGESHTRFEPMLLEGVSGETEVYAAGMMHFGTPNFAGVDTVKIHFHLEY